MLSRVKMQVLPRAVPARRLLSTIAPDKPAETAAPSSGDSPFALGRARIFAGNGRAIFIGIDAGALLLWLAGHVFNEHQRAKGGEPLSFSRFIPARTHSVSASPHAVVSPAPIIVQIDSSMIRVTAIALGHPRLAVINGQSVAEGDYVKVRSANPDVTVSLHVVKIGDGRIDLSDGRRLISTRLALPDRERE
jgi:hypothetical protein